MDKEKQKQMFDGLVLNAGDFLLSAATELKDSPKFSLLHFAAGIEMILKARLMNEHWTLILEDVKRADWTKFEQHDFISVTVDEAIRRIEKVTGHVLPAPAVDAIKDVNKARNKLIHFYHDDFTLLHMNELLPYWMGSKRSTVLPATSETIHEDNRRHVAVLQCRTWHHLYEMIQKLWKTIFERHNHVMRSIQKSMLENDVYLTERYQSLKPEMNELIAEGHIFTDCVACRQPAALIEDGKYLVRVEKCRVCGTIHSFMMIDCPEPSCSGEVMVIEGAGICPKCDYEIVPGQLIDELVGVTDPSDPDDFSVIYCHYCLWVDTCPDGKSAVRMDDGGYLCVNCLEVDDKISACEYCSEYFTGTLPEGTYLTGCEFCDGRGLDD